MKQLLWLCSRYRDRQSKIIVVLEFLFDREAYRWRSHVEAAMWINSSTYSRRCSDAL